MSVRLAAGWARSRSQSVSVVPMIQCAPHGITNSTLFSVRRISPVCDVDAVAGHDEVDALRGAHLDGGPPAMSWISSVHTPVALTTGSGPRCRWWRPVSRSRDLDAGDAAAVPPDARRPPARWSAGTAP